MRIGIDFDNTIICYDEVFCSLAKSWKIIDSEWRGNKEQLKSIIHSTPEGDALWQRLQGKVYGQFIQQANLFPGFKEFIATCNTDPSVEVFIVSHKTEFGHFDEAKIPLRKAALSWLEQQDFFNQTPFFIPPSNIFFESTIDDKIDRITKLGCTHFIDDLVKVLNHQAFPKFIHRFLFRTAHMTVPSYASWKQLQDEIFVNTLRAK